MKTDGALQDRCYDFARALLVAVLAFVGIVSIWTPFLNSAIAERWFSWPNLAYLSPVPLITALVTFWHWRTLAHAARDPAVRPDAWRCSCCPSLASGSASGPT